MDDPTHWTIEELARLADGAVVVVRDAHSRTVRLPEALEPLLARTAGVDDGAWTDHLGQIHPHDVGASVDAWWRAVARPGEPITNEARRRVGDGWRVPRTTYLNLLHQPDVHAVLLLLRTGEQVDAPDPAPRPGAATVASAAAITQELDAIGRILRTDGDVAHVFGHTAEELLGRAVTDHLHPDDLEASVAMWIDLLGEPEGSRTIEQRIVRPDHSTVWLRSTIVNRLDRDGALVAVSHETTAQRAQQAALAASEQELRFLTEEVPVAVWRAMASGAVTLTNARCDRLLGPVTDLEGIADRLARQDAQRFLDACAEVVADGDETTSLVARSTDGRHLELRLRSVADPLDPTGRSGLIGTVDDVTDAVARATDLAERADRDPLTGLHNRGATRDVLRRALATGDPELLVLFLDLDRFKAVNDVFGHATGDRVLTEVGARLAAAVRPGDVVGRWGGDEFLVVCPRVPAAAEGEVVTRLHLALGPVVAVGTGTVDVGASIGSVRPIPGEGTDELVARADAAMYAAKRDQR